MFVIQWNNVIKVVLVMEQFPNYIVDVLDGECRSWNLVMVGVGVLKVQGNGGKGLL